MPPYSFYNNVWACLAGTSDDIYCRWWRSLCYSGGRGYLNWDANGGRPVVLTLDFSSLRLESAWLEIS